MSRINLFGYLGHVNIFSWMFTIACCLVVGLGLGLGLGLDLASGWLSCYAHAYVLFSGVIVTHPLQTESFSSKKAENWRKSKSTDNKIFQHSHETDCMSITFPPKLSLDLRHASPLHAHQNKVRIRKQFCRLWVSVGKSISEISDYICDYICE